MYSAISIILLCIIVTLSIVIGYLLRQHKKKQTLSQPDQFYKKILELDLEGYVGINGSGKLIEVNKAYTKMSGYSKKELLRMHVKQLEGLETPTDIAHHFEFIQKHGSDRFE
ncbi:MAG: PAS domain S-box protein, partial [Sphaerochaeta sp.]